MADLPPTDWFQNLFGLKLPHLFPGLAGGLVRGLVVHNLSWPQRLSSAVVGGLTAGYGTPTVAAEFTRWLEGWWVHPGFYDPGYWDGSVGFCLGLVGMTLCDVLIRWARRWRDGPPSFPTPPRSSG